LTTSKLRSLVSLRFASTPSYQDNLEHLITLIDHCDDTAVIVAPEVCLSGYDYENFEAAAAFTPHAITRLLKHLGHRILVLTVIEKNSKGIYNVAKVLHGGAEVYQQPKARLFTFGDEHHYFQAGKAQDIVVFEVEGIRMGILICFEIRFKTLWQQLEGADIIAIPARWGKARAQNFRSLTNALAIMNQCYVVASDAANEEFSDESGIITPFGKEIRNTAKEIATLPYEPHEVIKMRRYMQVGIS